jgi:hypothetical protein
LLIRRDPLLLRDFRLDFIDAVPLFHVHRDGLPVQSLDVDLDGSEGGREEGGKGECVIKKKWGMCLNTTGKD